MDSDIISVMVVCSSKKDLSGFSIRNGFSLVFSGTMEDFFDRQADCRADLILMYEDSLADHLLERALSRFNDRTRPAVPALFCVLAEYPGSKRRMRLLKSGFTGFLIQPYSLEELKAKLEIFQNNFRLEQEKLIREKKMSQAFHYLDLFKKELETVKKELYEERVGLNNALKQVTRMTRERRRLRKDRKALMSSFHANMEGFSDILADLIKVQVEKNRGHSERVAHISQFVGKELGLDEKKLEDLRKAAMLHEVGLLFVSRETLNKEKSRLSDFEKDQFIQHPVKGADLISKCSEFKNCARIIRSMHENSDGTGYPEGLKRRYIPLPSKILAGADLFDQLKDSGSVTDLQSFLQNLETYSGNRLDPSIVAVLEKYAVLHMGSDAYNVKGVGIHQLEPGMTLGTAIFTNTGTKLFSVNTLLTQNAIDKIKKYNREYPVDETVYIRA